MPVARARKESVIAEVRPQVDGLPGPKPAPPPPEVPTRCTGGQFPSAVTALYGEFDFAEDKVYEAVEDLILVGDLVVQRHRFGVQGLGKGA